MANLKNGWRIWGWMLIAATFLQSCNKEQVPTGSLFGTIYFHGTTIPVPDVIVDVNGKTDTSGFDGSYKVGSVPAGEHQVLVRRPGFETIQIRLTLTALALERNFQIASESFTSKVMGSIRGNQTGNPKPGVTVLLLNPDGTESSLQSLSDPGGRYELDSVPQGDRTILFRIGTSEITRSKISLQNWDYILDIEVPEPPRPFEFTDTRDGNTYSALLIGKQTWMLDNLRYLPAVYPPGQESSLDSRYYVYLYPGNDAGEAKGSSYYSQFGVAYNFPAAVKACPEGWHLPSDEEWTQLQINLGMSRYESTVEGFQYSGDVGYKLKSETGWPDGENGDNSSHLNLLPCGGKMDRGSFYLPDVSVLWTASEFDDDRSWTRIIKGDTRAVYRSYCGKQFGHYVRCVRNR